MNRVTTMINAGGAAGISDRMQRTVIGGDHSACAGLGGRETWPSNADSATLVALVAADVGVALAPASLRHLRINGATFRPLRNPRITTRLALADCDDTAADPLIRCFLDSARTLVRSRDAIDVHTPPSPTTTTSSNSVPSRPRERRVSPELPQPARSTCP